MSFWCHFGVILVSFWCHFGESIVVMSHIVISNYKLVNGICNRHEFVVKLNIYLLERNATYIAVGLADVVEVNADDSVPEKVNKQISIIVKR